MFVCLYVFICIFLVLVCFYFLVSVQYTVDSKRVQNTLLCRAPKMVSSANCEAAQCLFVCMFVFVCFLFLFVSSFGLNQYSVDSTTECRFYTLLCRAPKMVSISKLFVCLYVFGLFVFFICFGSIHGRFYDGVFQCRTLCCRAPKMVSSPNCEAAERPNRLSVCFALLEGGSKTAFVTLIMYKGG